MGDTGFRPCGLEPKSAKGERRISIGICPSGAAAILQGYSVYYAAAAKVYHSHHYALPKTFKRYFKIGRFFADNKWVLQHAGLRHYGGSMLKAGVETLWQEGVPQYIAVFLMDFAVKAIAFNLGWCYQLLFHKKQRTGS